MPASLDRVVPSRARHYAGVVMSRFTGASQADIARRRISALTTTRRPQTGIRRSRPFGGPRPRRRRPLPAVVRSDPVDALVTQVQFGVHFTYQHDRAIRGHPGRARRPQGPDRELAIRGAWRRRHPRRFRRSSTQGAFYLCSPRALHGSKHCSQTSPPAGSRRLSRAAVVREMDLRAAAAQRREHHSESLRAEQAWPGAGLTRNAAPQ